MYKVNFNIFFNVVINYFREDNWNLLVVISLKSLVKIIKDKAKE